MGVLWLPLGWLLALWVLLGVLLGLSGCFLRAPEWLLGASWVLVGLLGGDSVSPGDPLVVSWAGLGASWVSPWWLLGFFWLLAGTLGVRWVPPMCFLGVSWVLPGHLLGACWPSGCLQGVPWRSPGSLSWMFSSCISLVYVLIVECILSTSVFASSIAISEEGMHSFPENFLRRRSSTK